MCIKTGKVKKSALSLLLFANHCNCNYNTIGFAKKCYVLITTCVLYTINCT